MKLSIVDLHQSDTALINKLSHVVYEAFLDHAPGWLPTVQDAREEIIESLQPKKFSLVLTDSKGDPLGWIATASQFNGRVWEIHPLAIAVSQQGKGFGKKLVRDIERLADQNGVLTLWAGTSDQTNATTLSGTDLYQDPAAAIASIRSPKGHAYEFWVKAGFTVVGIMPDAEGLGKPEIVLAKRVGK